MISLKKKDNIPIHIKISVWNKCSIYPLHPEITKCQTCNNLVMMPQALKHLTDLTYDIKPIYIDGKQKNISGVAEFGHIISENNCGKVHEDNLIIQCKTCNTRQGSKNIEFSQIIRDCDMIDLIDNLNIEMGENFEKCQKVWTAKLI